MYHTPPQFIYNQLQCSRIPDTLYQYTKKEYKTVWILISWLFRSQLIWICTVLKSGYIRVQQDKGSEVHMTKCISCIYFQSWQKLQYRMSLLVNELRKSELTTYRTTIMALINAIIFANENIRDRVRIRNEFICKYNNTRAVRTYQI